MLEFFKNLIFPPWSDEPANLISCCCALFLWPAGYNLIFVLQNSTPGGVCVHIPKTLSQIIVSRDQIFINFWCQMSICDNSLLISSIFGSRSGYISLDPEHCQVSICDNSHSNSVIFGFLELSYFAFLYHFIVIISRDGQCRFVTTVQQILIYSGHPCLRSA